MKNKKILLSLIFVLALSSCANTSQGEKASVSDSTIEDALNSEEKADKEKIIKKKIQKIPKIRIKKKIKTKKKKKKSTTKSGENTSLALANLMKKSLMR